MVIDYTKRTRSAAPAVKPSRNVALAAFIAAGSTDPNRGLQLTGNQSVNLNALAAQRRT